MKKIIITLFLLIGTITYGQTHGDVSLSKTRILRNTLQRMFVIKY